MDTSSSSLKLVSVELTHCFFDKKVLVENKIQRETTMNVNLEIGFNQWKDEDARSMMGVFVNVVISHPFDQDTITAARCTMAGFFEMLGEPAPEADLARWAHVNCAAIIFPFLREHLSSMYVKANLGPFLLPPINFEQYYQKLLEKNGAPPLPTDTPSHP